MAAPPARDAGLLARGGVESPTFRSSGLRCSVRQRSAPFVTCAGASSRQLADARERTRMRRERRRVPGHRPHRSTQDFRKPMLYPLSYEGLRCTFAQHGGRVLVHRARAGCLVPDSLCRTCAACRGPASHHRPHTRRRLYGGWCRAQSWRPRKRRGNDVVAVGCGDARRVDGTAELNRCGGRSCPRPPGEPLCPSVAMKCRTGQVPMTLSQVRTYPPLTLRCPFLNRVSQVRILPGAPPLLRRNRSGPAQMPVDADLVFCHRLSLSGPVCHRSRNHCETGERPWRCPQESRFGSLTD